MVNSRVGLERFYQFQARDLLVLKSEPETLSVENFVIMVQIKLNKMAHNANGSYWKPTNILLCLVLPF